MLAGLENLAGSSAGALTATCLAAGLSASQFEDCTADPLFRPGILDSLKGGSDVARLYPGLKLEGGLAPAVSSLKIVDQTTTKSVHYASSPIPILGRNNCSLFLIRGSKRIEGPRKRHNDGAGPGKDSVAAKRGRQAGQRACQQEAHCEIVVHFCDGEQALSLG